MDKSQKSGHELGPHYANFPEGYQPIDIIEKLNLNFTAGNVIKYLLRYKFKDGIKDLEKAQWNLARFIEEVKAAEAGNVLVPNAIEAAAAVERFKKKLKEQSDKSIENPRG